MIWTRALLVAALIFTPLAAYGQAAQPVVPLVGGAPVSGGNPMPVSGFVQSTSSGIGTPISVTTGGVTGTIPLGTSPTATEVIATNVGTTNGAYCQTGASATTSSQYIAPNGGWFAFALGSPAATQLTCITSTSTTTVNMVAGAGLPTGTGGGGGSGSSGAVYGPTANGSPAANPPVLMGGTADGTATGNVGNAEVKAGNSVGTTDPAVAVADANLLAAAKAPVPGYYATAYNTCSQVTGTTAPICVDLNGNIYANISRYFGSVASPNAAVMTVQPAGGDPCQTLAKTYTPINYSSSGLNTTPLVAGTSAKLTYVCQIILNNNAAETVGIIETTTGTSCATDVQALWGGATHSSSSAGFQFAATGGVSIGNGSGTIAVTKTANDDICFIQSASTQLTGGILWVQK